MITYFTCLICLDMFGVSTFYRVVKEGGSKGRGFPNLPYKLYFALFILVILFCLVVACCFMFVALQSSVFGRRCTIIDYYYYYSTI